MKEDPGITKARKIADVKEDPRITKARKIADKYKIGIGTIHLSSMILDVKKYLEKEKKQDRVSASILAVGIEIAQLMNELMNFLETGKEKHTREEP